MFGKNNNEEGYFQTHLSNLQYSIGLKNYIYLFQTFRTQFNYNFMRTTRQYFLSVVISKVDVTMIVLVVHPEK